MSIALLRTALALLGLGLLGGLLGLPACGTAGGQDRPVLVGSFPAAGTTVPTGLTSIRLDFDEPVRLFLLDKLVYRADGVAAGMFLSQEPGEPQSIRVNAPFGSVIGPGTVTVDVLEGLVLNAEDHYALDPQRVSFFVAGAPSFFLGSPSTNSVSAVHGGTLALQSSTPTPGARDPVGLVAVQHGSVTRVFAQLASGGGTGRSLAVFAPGAAAMTEVLLTPSPGSDLVAARPGLALAPDGRTLFAAFRDNLSQRVRLHRVRVSDGVETGVLVLSPAAGASTAPTGLTLRGDGLTLLVPCSEGATGRLCYVDLPSFTELDRDVPTPGVQGVALGGPAGPAEPLFDTLCLAPLGAATAALTLVTLGADTVTGEASTQPGTPTSVLTTFDFTFALEGLGAPGAAPNLLCVRPGADLATDAPLGVSDLVGLAAQSTTAVRALARVPGLRSFYVLLDADVLARFSWSSAGVVQDDLDAATAGVQALGLAPIAPGATSIGVLVGAYPP